MEGENQHLREESGSGRFAVGKTPVVVSWADPMGEEGGEGGHPKKINQSKEGRQAD